MSLFICQFCGRETTNPGANKKHENTCKLNPNPVQYVYHNKGGPKKGSIPWNKGLTKETSEIIAKSAKENSLKFKGENNSFYGKKHSIKTKRRISKSRKKYLEENPDRVPYRLNHYSKGPSYPEIYWKKIFDENNVRYVEQHPISLYQLDFAILDKKIDIEIDGEQHYLDERIVESDKKRTRYLESLGWTVVRIRWSEYQRISNEQSKKEYIRNIIERIT